eukprot:SM000106S13974  [mRNA]  locus=s106:307298:309121:+ [translate_table: standard]
MAWTEVLYRPVFAAAPGFALREHDYVFSGRKFGGNAQSITKDRWLHHTSFLWDYDPVRMAYLTVPNKAPTYRQGRSHLEFITSMKEHFSSPEDFFSRVIGSLEDHFELQAASLAEAEEIVRRKHARSTRVLDLRDSLHGTQQTS